MTAQPAITTTSEAAAEASIDAAAHALSLPTVRAEAGALADAAARDGASHRAFLAELLSSEVEARAARRRDRRIRVAQFPRTKTLASFDFAAAPAIPAGTVAALVDDTWIDRGEPVVLLGDSGIGKSHLLIALSTAACEQGRRVRYRTAASLVTSSPKPPTTASCRAPSPATAASSCCCSTSSATSNSTPAAPNCSSKSSPNARNAPASP